MKPTGRVFTCIGLKENMYPNWNWNYRVGIEYKEFTDKIKTKHDTEVLFLLGDFSAMYADSNQFQEVKNQSLEEILNELNITLPKY